MDQSAPLLAIDTSSRWCSVALAWPDRTDSLNRPMLQGHSHHVLAMIDELLARNSCGRERLGAVAFGAGPGSFTGVRIGCGVAQGLSLALSIPCFGIDCLRARADKRVALDSIARLRPKAARIAVIIDARMGQWYTGIYSPDVDATGELFVADPQQCCRRLARIVQSTDLEIISEVGPTPELAALGIPIAGVDGAELACTIARRAHRMWSDGQRPGPLQAAPLYVRNKVALDVDEQAAQRSLLKSDRR